MIKGLDNFVSLEPVSHKYFDLNGREYMSVSRLISLFKQPFDRENISRAVAKKRGISQQEVLDEWDTKKDNSINHGNRIHNALERFDKSTVILPEDESLREVIMSVSKEYAHYFRNYPEQVLYNEEFGVAGTTDKLSALTSHHSSPIDVSDYKTNLEKGIYYCSPYNTYLTGPLSHLQDCNYNTYALQLSTYAWMVEQKTGRRIGRLYIRFFPPTNLLGHYIIPLPYMKYEVETMMKFYKQNHLNLAA